MINIIPYSYFVNGEFLGLFANVVKLSNNADSTLLKIKTQVDDLDASVITANKLYLTQRKSQDTANIITEDEVRDDLLIGFGKVVEGNTYNVDKALAKNAITIQLCIDKYGKNIVRQSLVKETNTINSLVDDLETDILVKAAVTALGLGSWVSSIKTANQTFNDTYLNRTKEVGERIDGPLLPNRLDIQAKYEQLKSFTEANQVLTPLPAGATLINSLNTLIAEYVVTAKKRRAAGKSTPPATPPVPPTI